MEISSSTLLLRPDEVAKITGWCRSKVYAMAASGEIPALRCGRSVRVPRAALEKWIARNTTAMPLCLKEVFVNGKGYELSSLRFSGTSYFKSWTPRASNQ